MTQLPFVTVLAAARLCAAPASAQDDDYARQVAQERRQAEFEAPQLAEVLGLKPDITVADIGTGGGAMAMVLGRLVGSGRVYATDITQRSLRITREYAKKEGLTNITVIEGGAASTNLPSECCEALFVRNVYHHVTEPAAFNKSLYATAKPRARLAVIDAPPDEGSNNTRRPANRGGHGVPATVVIDELIAAGFAHVRTICARFKGGRRETNTLRSSWRCSRRNSGGQSRAYRARAACRTAAASASATHREAGNRAERSFRGAFRPRVVRRLESAVPRTRDVDVLRTSRLRAA